MPSATAPRESRNSDRPVSPRTGPPSVDLRDGARRRLLARLTGLLGGAALGAAAYPFLASLEPSARALALAGPVEIDIAGLAPLDLQVVAWRGKPVWIMRRTDAVVGWLRRPHAVLADPTSRYSKQPENCANEVRSVRPDVFVAVGLCTHLGCSPQLRLNASAGASLGPGGFVCPCHGSRFDLAGRVVKGVPAPINLDVPPYQFASESRIRIG
jgi:ubiquinol-cytochrome c reductase iron-sulfur subunit